MTAETPKYEALVDTWRSGYREGLAAAFMAAIECGGDMDAIRAKMHRQCTPLQPRTSCPVLGCGRKDER